MNTPTDLRALTIRQPYASRITHGRKRVENRSKPISTRGLILIHAAAAPHQRFAGKPMPLPLSAIIGAAQLVGSHNAETCGGRCAEIGGEYLGDALNEIPPHLTPQALPPIHHWELRDVVAFQDADVVRDVRGMLGLWTVTNPSTAGLVRLALEGALSA
jgi:hypothetical protein